MKIDVVCMGKLREKFFREAVEEYLTRLRRFVQVSVTEVDNPNKIERLLEGKDFIIILDEKGEEMDSFQFAELIRDLSLSKKNICFVVGGWEGLDDRIKRKANLVWSLSKLTFPYQMARLLLLEQTYRAFTIIKGIDYHK
ncbi:MAG: 23S rRNA (pseudouridine(1915)-N(3))-methyltransferase RlmH [Thermoplasmata archaeon]|nr:MAG: 23S rRNA (pseudouridine(1915)-N(3))-methyltransferase RlmH [Thermoplasmata archaeon]